MLGIKWDASPSPTLLEISLSAFFGFERCSQTWINYQDGEWLTSLRRGAYSLLLTAWQLFLSSFLVMTSKMNASICGSEIMLTTV